MKAQVNFIKISCILMLILVGSVDAQQNLAQEAYAIFEQSCLICHGENGSYRESLIIEHAALIKGGTVVPGNPDASVFFQRLIESNVSKRMPLGQPPLDSEAITTIRQWILAGAPDWSDTPRPKPDFITNGTMLGTIENHVNSLTPFDRSFARYFTLTHLYNAGETTEALNAYRRALSKLINSLSWGRQVVKPQPIDAEQTIFYIDLRDYEWDVRNDAWTQIEQAYPYKMTFDAPTQTHLHEKLTTLQQEMNCEVPFVHIDWFLATASLPPLYHDILALPKTDRELEASLEVFVTENLLNAPGKRVWRAGFNNSGVSRHNRVVERHISRYGAYWKSYDFAGSAESQNIFTHPLDFIHDGGEIIFNLPNGLQAYYLVDGEGNRLDVAPTDIVSNPAVSDPAVRNGLSCIGCHTEGMKTFEDEVRAAVEEADNPPFNKDRALNLYVERAVMADLVAEDTQRYRTALEAAGGVFGGIEPVQRFHEAFQGPLDAAHAAAAVGFETEVFLEKISENVSLQNLLGTQILENSTVKRDTWTYHFEKVISLLNTPDTILPPVEQRPERIPGATVHIPDAQLRASIEKKLGKASGDPITIKEMKNLPQRYTLPIDIHTSGVENLEGIQFATNLQHLSISYSSVTDLSPLSGLTKLERLSLREIARDRAPNGSILKHHNLDLSPLEGLTKLKWLYIVKTRIDDLSPLSKLNNLRGLTLYGCPNLRGSPDNISDISPLAALTNLGALNLSNNNISDISPLAALTNLGALYLFNNNISDISSLSAIPHNFFTLDLGQNNISDISPLANMQGLRKLLLDSNNISDVTPLANLHRLEGLLIQHNDISDISPLNKLRERTNKVFWHDNPGFPQGGPEMIDSWVWGVIPAEEIKDHSDPGIPGEIIYINSQVSFARDADLLLDVTDGSLSELEVATNGAIVGNPVVGEHVWTPHKFKRPPGEYDEDFYTRRQNTLKIPPYGCVVYGSVTLYSPREQQINMFDSSAEGHKIWLNGELVRDWRIPVHLTAWTNGRNSQWGRWLQYPLDYTAVFPVTLKRGRNVLLIAMRLKKPGDLWGHFGFEPDAEYTLSKGIGYALSQDNIFAGDTFTLTLNAENLIDLAGWQADIAFDPNMLEAVEVTEGDFLKQDNGNTYFQAGTIDNTAGKITGLLSARSTQNGVSGIGHLLYVTFIAKATGETKVTLENYEFGSSTGAIIPSASPNIILAVEAVEKYSKWDINQDEQIDILDLVLVAQDLGADTPANERTDVNGDGVINIQDIILVGQHINETETAAAPPILAIDDEELMPDLVQTWIDQAQAENDGSLAFRQGIENLERLLASLIPEKTALLVNYPNPFNPETWIPYHLAKPAEVTLKIYAANGAVVRTLALGHQAAGIYQSRSRAAHWDGRNSVGESVASGIYFYMLTADDFTATRKMLILK
ncbi:MAG: cohesin domain-containing protein [Candidatus Poribacteria bacterium]|nr:cohesin domain-containing protein [Candidatus Poribacteria bacterium]